MDFVTSLTALPVRETFAAASNLFAVAEYRTAYQIGMQALDGVYNLFCYLRNPEELKTKTFLWFHPVNNQSVYEQVGKIQKIANMFLFMQIFKIFSYIPLRLLPLPLTIIPHSGPVGFFANVCGTIGASLMAKAQTSSLGHQIKWCRASHDKIAEKSFKLLSYLTTAASLAIQILIYLKPSSNDVLLLSTAHTLGMASIGFMAMGVAIWSIRNRQLIVTVIKNTIAKCQRVRCQYLSPLESSNQGLRR